jgi:heme exporter protein A
VPSSSPPGITVTSLSCSRGNRRLFSDIGFRLNAGSALHLEGANGSGKTTLLRSVAGLTEADSGDIHWCGESIQQIGDDYRQQVAYVGHLNGLQPELNLLENLRYSAGLSGLRPRPNIEAAVDRLGLTDRAELPIKLLSQGQKRRAALCRLMLGQQTLWLLDEPLTALDNASISILKSLFRDHLQNGGLLIYTSHQLLDLGSGVTRLRIGA